MSSPICVKILKYQCIPKNSLCFADNFFQFITLKQTIFFSQIQLANNFFYEKGNSPLTKNNGPSELNSLIGTELKSQMLDSHNNILRTNKLVNDTKISISLNELDKSDNLATSYLLIMWQVLNIICFWTHNPHNIKKLHEWHNRFPNPGHNGPK